MFISSSTYDVKLEFWVDIVAKGPIWNLNPLDEIQFGHVMVNVDSNSTSF